MAELLDKIQQLDREELLLVSGGGGIPAREERPLRQAGGAG